MPTLRPEVQRRLSRSDRHVDLQELRYLVAIDDEGSFAKAAAKLSVAQSAVSARIRRVEETLGVDLFVRTSTGSHLTPSGIVFVAHARIILERLDQAIREVKQKKAAANVMIQLGLPSGAGRVLTIPILKSVEAKLSGITIRVVEALSGDLEQQLTAGQLDLSLLFKPRSKLELQAGMEQVGMESLYLVSSRRSRRQPEHAQPVTFDELARIELTMPTSRHQVRRFLSEAAERDRVPLNIVREMDSNARIMELVLHEGAYSVMLLPAFLPELRAGRIIARRVRGIELERIVVTAPCRHKHRAEMIQAVRQLVLSVAEQVAEEGSASLND
jgi:DNA-binding transcriptional LysR family regulator